MRSKISGGLYSQQDLKFLTVLSRQISIALANVRLYDDGTKRKEELEKFHKLTVGRELRMVELKERIKKLEKQKRNNPILSYSLF